MLGTLSIKYPDLAGGGTHLVPVVGLDSMLCQVRGRLQVKSEKVLRNRMCWM